MVEYKSCKRWFHRKCEKILASVFSAGKLWSCLYCQIVKIIFLIHFVVLTFDYDSILKQFLFELL